MISIIIPAFLCILIVFLLLYTLRLMCPSERYYTRWGTLHWAGFPSLQKMSQSCLSPVSKDQPLFLTALVIQWNVLFSSIEWNVNFFDDLAVMNPPDWHCLTWFMSVWVARLKAGYYLQSNSILFVLGRRIELCTSNEDSSEHKTPAGTLTVLILFWLAAHF